MEGRVLTMNRGAVEIFGYNKEELIGKKRVSIFSPGEIVIQNVGNWLATADKFGEFVTKVTPSENEKSFSERENVPMIPNKVDPKKPQGFMRAVAGYADWLTLNTFDFV